MKKFVVINKRSHYCECGCDKLFFRESELLKLKPLNSSREALVFEGCLIKCQCGKIVKSNHYNFDEFIYCSRCDIIKCSKCTVYCAMCDDPYCSSCVSTVKCKYYKIDGKLFEGKICSNCQGRIKLKENNSKLILEKLTNTTTTTTTRTTRSNSTDTF